MITKLSAGRARRILRAANVAISSSVIDRAKTCEKRNDMGSPLTGMRLTCDARAFLCLWKSFCRKIQELPVDSAYGDSVHSETGNITAVCCVPYETRFLLDTNLGERVALCAKRTSSEIAIPKPFASFSTTSMEGLRVPRSISVRYVRWRKARWASFSCVRFLRNRKSLTASPSRTLIFFCPLPTYNILQIIHLLSTDNKQQLIRCGSISLKVPGITVGPCGKSMRRNESLSEFRIVHILLLFWLFASHADDRTYSYKPSSK
jgi:hypothetical protein